MKPTFIRQPQQRQQAIGISAIARKTVFLGMILTVMSVASHQSVLAQDYTWTTRTAVDNDWWSATYGNGLFVAVASYGTGNGVMTSPDGITWTIRTPPNNDEWRSVTYGNGLFVAVAANGTTADRIMTSPDGINWTLRPQTFGAIYNTWTGVTYANGLFVAVAASGFLNRVMTSPDGITWTSQTTPNNDWRSVTYGNGRFVAVATSGTGDRVMTSPDGITWTSQTSASNDNWTGVTFGKGLFVAVGITGAGQRVMTSPDGVTWTLRTSAANHEWFSVIYGNGLFAAVSISGTAMTSPDGITWTLRTPVPFNNSWKFVTYGNGRFVAVGPSSTSTGVMTMNWQAQMAINAGNSQTAAVGTAVATAPSVIVRDPLNNPVSGVTVTFAVASGGGSITGGSATTNASGIATVGSWTLGMTPSNTLTATSTGLSGSPVTFTAAGSLPLTGSTQIEGTAVPGGTVTVTTTLANTLSTNQSITLNAPLPAGLIGVSCVSATGTCVIGATTVTASGRAEIYRKQSASASTSTVNLTGTIPGNATVTITYVVQVSPVASNGTQYQLTSTINGFPGPSATMTVSATPAGPGDSIGLMLGQAAAQKPGSVLIYNLYASGSNPAVSDSRISITNTSPVRSSYVHFFFVDGSNCSVADMTITLTANQTASFLASDFDPGVTGYLIAVATDGNGCPEVHNHLVGESQVRLESGHRAALPALSVAALGLGGPTCSPNATTTTVAFDGLSYNALSRTLAVSGLSSIANGNSSLLVVNRIGGDLGTGAARLGSLFGLLYDDQEASQSFTLTGNFCQLRGVLGNNFPRTSPRYTTVIPAGRTGWMKFAAVADEAITGVLLVEALDGFNGGHNLHHLTTTGTATLTIPVYPAE